MQLRWIPLLLLIAACATDAAVTNTKQTDRGILITTSSGVIELQAWGNGTIRVESALRAPIPQKTSFVVVDQSPPAKWSVQEDAHAVRLTTDSISASIDKKIEFITFFDHDGKPLLQESSDGRSLKPATQPARDGLQISESFTRNADERYFGMGVINDQLEQLHTSIPLLNNNSKIQVPVLYSSKGYGIFWDNASSGEFKLTPTTMEWASSAGDAIDYYVMAGPSADQVIGEYRQLTGQAPLFPLWAYGFWFCKNRFTSQDEILQAAKDFRTQKIPIDLIVQDYFYWASALKPQDKSENWGSHAFDAKRYPDPKGMISQLHDADHLHFMAVVWGKFNPITQHAKELDAAGALFPPGKDWAGPSLRYYDPFFKKGREIFGKQVMDSLLPLGLDGFWIDGAEPEMDKNIFASFNSEAGPVSRIMNTFPLMHTAALYDAQRASGSEKRVVLLPRSAWPGMQRNAAANWTGDIKGDWKTFEWQIRGLQNYSITGLPYITTDIGGYAPTRESDQEHFLRWFEWGTFCPILRVHGIDRAFPWQYGSEAEAIIRNFDDLRYRLLPYIYSQAAEVTQHAGTIMRPLVMDFRDDPKAVDTWDEFMFGPQLLVCPVHESRYETLPITQAQFADNDGKPSGLSVTYFKSGNEKPERVELPNTLTVRFAGNPKGITGLQVEGTFTATEAGSILFRAIGKPGAPYDPARTQLTIDGKSFTPTAGFQHITIPLDVKAGQAIHIVFKGPDLEAGFRILRDRFPVKSQTRDVYLPTNSRWYDFWTGETLEGGKNFTVDAPLGRIPLYIRAGSILPMGPKLQYAAEHPADPIELRVYPGAEGSFNLYEDQGDSYAYEKGAFATIPISWNDKKRELTVGDRQGKFPGMLEHRTFRVVWVKPDHGGGIEPAQTSDIDLQYNGTAVRDSAQ